MSVNCNLCKHISLTEYEQLDCVGKPHVCLLYNKELSHRTNKRGFHQVIYPCEECNADNNVSYLSRFDNIVRVRRSSESKYRKVVNYEGEGYISVEGRAITISYRPVSNGMIHSITAYLPTESKDEEIQYLIDNLKDSYDEKD